MIYEQFVSKLEKNKIEYTLLRFYSATYVEVVRKISDQDEIR